MIQLTYLNDGSAIAKCEKCGHDNHVHPGYDYVMSAVRSACRYSGGRVFPKHVAPIVGYSEYHTREIMRRLAQTGKLRRIGERGGYILPEAI